MKRIAPAIILIIMAQTAFGQIPRPRTPPPSNDTFSSAWNGQTARAPSMNAVYDAAVAGFSGAITWGSGLSFAAGTAAFAPTELEALTWGPGTSASWAWTFDVTGATNPTMTVSATGMAFSHNVAGATYGSDGTISDAELLGVDDGLTTQLFVGGGAGVAGVWTTATGTGAPVRADSPTFTDDIQLAADGVLLSGADGDLTILGKGNGFDEDLTIDLDTTENTGTITSSTGLATMNFSGIALQESGNAVPNATDHLGFFAATTSAQLYGVLSDETGSASGSPVAVFSVSPTLTGTPLVGTTAAGGNLTINATEEAEMTPALEAANWTCTDGWSAGTGTVVKIAGAGTGTATPSGAFSVTAGVKYKVVIVCSAVSGTLTYTLGGSSGTTITATTITDYIIASTTAKIIFSGGAAVTATITSVSVKALTDATGDTTVIGVLKANRIRNLAGTDAIAIGPTGNVGIAKTDAAHPLDIAGNMAVSGSIILGTIQIAETSGAIRGRNLPLYLTAGADATIPAITIGTNKTVGIGITAATKLDQGQFSADALGSGHTFSKSRHATAGSHTIVNDNDVIGFTNYAPSDGVDFGTIAARIHGETDDDAPAGSSIGGALVFSTAAGLAADDLTERVRIDRYGLMTVKSFASTGIVTKVAGDSPYTPLATDFHIRGNAVGGAIIVTIPDATGSGRILVVKKVDASANTISLTPAGGSLIDGAATQVIATQYSSIAIIDVSADVWDIQD